MEYRAFGKTGVKVSVIGLGTYFGPPWIVLAYALRWRRHAARSISALRMGLDAGINLIDTAEIYRTEPLVAAAIQGRKRDELFIASKVWRTHLHYDAVLRACKRSLQRLQTPYLDLYQIHFPSGRVPIAETMRAMERLVDEGQIHYIGISNFSLAQMEAAEAALRKYELTSTQLHYNLAHRDIERNILPHCEAARIALLAYYPLALGKLAGPHLRSKQVYRSLGPKYGEKTPAQVALNWLVARSPMVFPIPRGSNPPHVTEDLGAAGWRLAPPDVELLAQAFPT